MVITPTIRNDPVGQLEKVDERRSGEQILKLN